MVSTAPTMPSFWPVAVQRKIFRLSAAALHKTVRSLRLYIQKPFSKDALATMVRVVLDHNQVMEV